MINEYSAQDFGKVAVLMGGNSAEREISLITGNNILQALLNNGIDAHPIDVGSDTVSQLINLQPQRAFIALHGPGGEDGVIQGLLEYLHIPYTGSDVAASSLTMDKARTKWVWQANNLPTLPFLVTDQIVNRDSLINQFGLPICVKPVNEGSSVGISKVENADQLIFACENARQYQHQFIIEPWIEGKEYTIGILGNQALPVIEIRTPRIFYDYQAKYIDNDTQYICPCDLSKEQEKILQDFALKAFQVTGCRHWGRVDAMADRHGNFWLLEINTVPGMTDHSLVPKAAKVLGINFEELVLQILSYTLQMVASDHGRKLSNV